MAIAGQSKAVDGVAFGDIIRNDVQFLDIISIR